MFIYEKNKLNQETGKVEQSLNVTFEGNKPVETPDVVITKDGVTGIKSDSNAYIAYYRQNAYISYDLITDYITSYSVDGKITDRFPSNAVIFNRYFGFTFKGGNTETSSIVTMVSYDSETDTYNDIEFDNNDIYDGEDELIFKPGEFIFDAKNLTLQKPDGSISDYKNRLPYGLYGIALGGY